MSPAKLLVVFTSLLVTVSCAQLDTLFEWRTIDFTFPSPAARQAMINQGLFVPNNSVPLDVDIHGDRVFLTIPRFMPGIPATLATVRLGGFDKSPILEPYPQWSWHKPGSCQGMTSVFRVKIDECGRLWVIDTGSIDIFVGIKHACPKQLLVFDLHNDKLLFRHRFADSVLKADTLLTSVVVDVADRSRNGGKCRDVHAYVSDTTTYGLIVYDARRDHSWRVTGNSFFPIPHFGYFKMSGSEFDLMDGVIGLALSPHAGGKPRTLYYHSLASNTENHVSTAVLKNEANFPNGTNTVQRQFNTYPMTRRGQSATMDMSTTGILFYAEMMTNTLQCYNTKLEYKGANNPTVAVDNIRLQFPTGLKTGFKANGVEEVWLLTNRLQKLLDGSITAKEVNFRVLGAPVKRLIEGTNCAVNVDPIRFSERVGEGNERVVFKDIDG